MANHTTRGPTRGQPPTAVQYALAVVTAGLAVAAVMLALVGTAQANYLASLPQDEPYFQGPVYNISYPPAAPLSTPPPAKPTCPPALPATYSGSLGLLGQPAATDPITLTTSIDGQPWATATVSDGRYTIDIPRHTPDTPPCFPGGGTILFTLDGYTCMLAEEQEGTRWVACGYHSFTPGPHDVDLVCLAAPAPTPSPDAAPRASAPVSPGLGGLLEASIVYRQLWQAPPESFSAARAAFISGLIPYQAGDAAAATKTPDAAASPTATPTPTTATTTATTTPIP